MRPNKLVSDVLREAAIFAHYNDIWSPWAAILCSCDNTLPSYIYHEAHCSASDMYIYGNLHPWTTELTVLALLFAAAAVENP